MIRVLLIILSLSAVAQAQEVPGQDDGFSVGDAVAIKGTNAHVQAALKNDPSVVSIVPDFEIQAVQLVAKGKTSGGGGSTQVIPAGIMRVGVPTASSNGEGVGVAILDTGIDLTHTDLSVSPTSFSSFGGFCQDDNGHGTRGNCRRTR
jgi:subtilisin family serine protease